MEFYKAPNIITYVRFNNIYVVMNTEIWKDIENFEGLYQISNLGRVRSVDRVVHILDPKSNREYNRHFPECIKSTNLDTKGYVMVTLKKDGKTSRYRIHRLVAKAFIPNPNNLPQVNHKDENKENNCMSNLEWCTNDYNGTYGTRILRISEKRRGKSTHNSIKVEILGIVYESLTKAGQAIGVSGDTIKRRIENKVKGYNYYDNTY